MPKVQSLKFKGANEQVRVIDLISHSSAQWLSFQSTVITGQNGSHKSTLLRELVSALTLPENLSKIKLVNAENSDTHVICMSGSVADRFPLKDRPGGRHTDFDVPNYAYLGQRVGPNLLSKKRPLETILGFMLNEDKAERRQANFFQYAHDLAGIENKVEYNLFSKRSNYAQDPVDVLGEIQASARGVGSRKSSFFGMSKKTAEKLLEDFHYDEFNELQMLLNNRRRKVQLDVSPEELSCKTASNSALRLALLSGLYGVQDVLVTSKLNGENFSIFELSSGEYHIYTSILGLGFGITESSVILIDEPENSLHPQWQQNFMEVIYEICDQLLLNGHLIICTHAPLIVASVPEHTTVVDLSLETAEVGSVNYGSSSDELLLSQFGIASSRNRLVVDKVQRAVSLVERGDFNSPEFIRMLPDLKIIRDALNIGDPLADILNALIVEDALS